MTKRQQWSKLNMITTKCGDLSDPNNYRKIGLASTIAKMVGQGIQSNMALLSPMAKIIWKILPEILNIPLTSHQHDSRYQDSTDLV